jgi:hypothetical protein
MPANEPNLFDAPASPQAGAGANLFDLGGAYVPPSSSPATSRTPTENPFIWAMNAGNRFGKHLAATGHLGIPDQAGSDADEALIGKRMKSLNEPLTHLPGFLRPTKPIFGDGSFQSNFIDPTLLIPGKAYGAAAGAIGKLLGRGAKAGAEFKSYLEAGQRSPDLVRYEDTARTSPRGAKFYTPHSPENPAISPDRYEMEPGAAVGGTRRVEKISRAKNPYDSEYGPDEGSPIGQYLADHGNLPQKFKDELFGPHATSMLGHLDKRESFSRELLTHFGLSKAEIDKVVRYADASSREFPQAYRHIIQDRAAVEAAKRNGHDALTSFDEYVAADPRSVRSVPTGVRKTAESALLRGMNVGQSTAGVVGDIARATGTKWKDLNTWGGDIARKIGPEKYRDATLASNREGAMEAEEARRHGVNLAEITAGLTDEQRLDAYRIAHGEADVSSSAAVNAAAKALRTHLNDKYFLKADAAGRKRVAMGSPTVANARFTPTKEANLFRYQSAPGAPAGNPLRGGTSFSMGSPSEAYASHGRGLGGENLVGRVNTAKNPLDLRVKSDTWPLPKELDLQEKISQYQGMSVARKLRPDKPTYENLRRAFESGDSKTYQRYLKALGVPPEDIAAILKHDASAGRFAGLADERIGSEMARRAGHDAIIRPPSGPRSGKGSLNPELFALHPSAHAPAMPPPKKLDPFEQAVPESDFAPLPRHPDLPENQRLPSTLKSINRASPALQKTYELPENLREFTPPANQGVLGPLEYKKHYLPGNRGAPEIDPAERPKPYNRLFPNAPEANPQRPYKIGPGATDEAGGSKVASMDEVLAKSNKGTAKQTSAARLRQALGVKPGAATSPDDPLMKLFTETPEAKGAARNIGEHIAGAMRVPADLARTGLIAFSGKHGLINVPTLAAVSEGARPVGEMFGTAARTMRMSPEEKWEAQREAREAGVIGPEFERENPFLNWLGKVPTAARIGAGAAYGGYQGQDLENRLNPQGNLAERIAGGAAGAGLGAFALPIGKFGNASTWALDEAAKARVYAAKIAKGMKPPDAAMETLHDMIDYAHRTPLAKWLQHWGAAPFSTFATKVPGAIAGSIKRNPRNAILLDRLTQGLGSQGSIDLPGAPAQANGKPAQFDMSTPLSETIGGVVDPGKYLRSKGSDTANALGSLLSSALSGDLGNAFTGKNYKALYPTHGEPLLPHVDKRGKRRAGYLLQQALSHLPLGAGQGLLDSSGTGEYQPEAPINRLLGPMVGGYVR